jgi:peptidoglycan/xylan/chitin deacetylase (PgdA/CDA1 family)
MSTLSLMYHEVYPANASEYLSTTGPEFSAKRLYAVSDLAFASHLRMLRVSGMSFVLATADSMLASGASRQVILTFDDGGISAWDFTVPLLNLHAAKAHFFVCGDFVGKKGFLTRTHLLEMARQGHVIVFLIAHLRAYPI